MYAQPQTLQLMADLHRQDLLREAAAERLADQLQHSTGAAPTWPVQLALTALTAWLRS